MSASTRSVLVSCCAVLAFACGSGSSRETAAAPTFSPPEPLKFRTTQSVALATVTVGATIHYTTDGSSPTAASPVYDVPLALDASTTLRAIATRDGLNDSPVAANTYTLRPVDLALDDGTVENWAGFGGGAERIYLALDQFTPDPADFPFQLRTISLQVPNLAGTPVRLAVYSDPDGNPANGATLEATYDVVLAAGWSWSVHQLDPPVTLRGPGDVLIAQVTTESVLFGLDETTLAHRTWWGFWSDATAAQGLPLPANPVFGLLGEQGSTLAGTVLIRGSN